MSSIYHDLACWQGSKNLDSWIGTKPWFKDEYNYWECQYYTFTTSLALKACDSMEVVPSKRGYPFPSL